LDAAIVSPLYLPYDTAATTTLPFNYDFTDMSWSGGEVCLYNEISKTLTDYCIDITEESGMEYIDYPSPVSAYHLTGSYRLLSSGGSTLLTSEIFDIYWYAVNPEITNAEIFATSTADFVCTAEEWAVDSWWVRLKCSTFKTSLDIAEKIANIPKIIASGFANTLKNIFPFNIAAKFYESWQASETGALPDGLSFLTPADENGDISVNFPRQWAGTATTSIVIFGPGLVGSAGTTFFTGTRTLSTYLMWGIFIFGIYKMAKRIYEEFQEP